MNSALPDWRAGARSYFAVPAAERLAAEQTAATAVEFNRLGIAHAAAARAAQAAQHFEQALRICPTYAEAWFHLGLVKADARDAYECFAQAAILTPAYAAARDKLAAAAVSLGLPARVLTPWMEQAEPSWRARMSHAARKAMGNAVENAYMPLDPPEPELRAQLLSKPRSGVLARKLGRVLLRQQRFTESELFLRYALALAPWDGEAALWLCMILEGSGRRAELSDVARQAMANDSASHALCALALWNSLHLCDWRFSTELTPKVHDILRAAPVYVEPQMALHFTDDSQLAFDCAKHVHEALTTGCRPLAPATPREKRKLTLGYVSAEFRDHPVATLMAEVLELHDRRRFTVRGYAIWPPQNSKLANRMREACDKFTELAGDTHENLARKIRADEVDVLIDVTGFTQYCQPRIMGHRPAPVQVNYLGYPGTMGLRLRDYVIVDRSIVDESQQPQFAEACVFMPHSYQANDRTKAAPLSRSRAEYELPQDGVVFCCFNETRKILPETFAGWMRILTRVPDSVLWLLVTDEGTQERLRHEAAVRGLDSARLVFAPRMVHEDHLARYRVADLFLDTHPYNAHTTGSDALWFGCPMITMLGRSFQSRVGASLLRNVGLPELVTSSPSEYEDVAVRFGLDAAFRFTLQERLRQSGRAAPLFDTPRYVRQLEWAFEEMWRRHVAGEKPASFDVPRL